MDAGVDLLTNEWLPDDEDILVETYVRICTTLTQTVPILCIRLCLLVPFNNILHLSILPYYDVEVLPQSIRFCMWCSFNWSEYAQYLYSLADVINSCHVFHFCEKGSLIKRNDTTTITTPTVIWSFILIFPCLTCEETARSLSTDCSFASNVKSP
jgi:hypothetical protein